MIFWLLIGLGLVGILAYCCRRRVRQEYGQQTGLSVLTVTVVWLVYLGHLALTSLAAFLGIWALPINDWISFWTGSLLITGGIYLFVAGIISFGSLQRINGRLNNHLVTSGIYRWSRNPQNVGWVLCLLGVSIVGNSGFAMLLTALFRIRFSSYIKVEEHYLEAQFGGEYRKYLRWSHRYFGPPRQGVA